MSNTNKKKRIYLFKFFINISISNEVSTTDQSSGDQDTTETWSIHPILQFTDISR